MPVELPNLDDLSFDDLVAEGLKLITAWAPEWTNHNPSDPGIMLIELFAYLTEMQLYRLNRVTTENVYTYLQLISGVDYSNVDNANHALLDNTINGVIQRLRKSERAITCNEYEILAQHADPRVARSLCLPRRDLRLNFDADAPGHVGLIILPWDRIEEKKVEEKDISYILVNVRRYLELRRLLTTRVHVVGPHYLAIDISIHIILLPGYLETSLEQKVEKTLRSLLSPYPSQSATEGCTGWPFGRSVYVSEIFAHVDQIAGVDAVEDVIVMTADKDMRHRHIVSEQSLAGIHLKPHELVLINKICVCFGNK